VTISHDIGSPVAFAPMILLGSNDSIRAVFNAPGSDFRERVSDGVLSLADLQFDRLHPHSETDRADAQAAADWALSADRGQRLQLILTSDVLPAGKTWRDWDSLDAQAQFQVYLALKAKLGVMGAVSGPNADATRNIAQYEVGHIGITAMALGDA